MSMMWRALTARKRGRFQGEIPRFEVRRTGVECGDLAAFERLFELGEGTDVPITVPHLLAAPIQMELATRPDFPLPALGLIHTANRITRHRPMLKTTPLDLHVWIEGHRMTGLGVEFDVHTEASLDGECCWEEISTVLSRAVEGSGDTPVRSKSPIGPDQPGEAWDVPAGFGRAYARVSGDWNPIHLHSWAARPFGFSGAIAHGMALLSKAASALPDPGEGPVTLTAEFQKPVYLPASVIFQTAPEGTGHAFVVRGSRPNMIGWYGATS